MAEDKDPFKNILENVNPPNAQEVNKFHNHSDLDSSERSQHHTLGFKRGQASPGDHKHDGLTSKKLGSGVTVTGAKGGNAALTSLIAAMVSVLGITDSTS